jgi:hypothetical protein
MTDASPYLFWITSRAAGIAALVLASLAVCVGLSMQTRLLGVPVQGVAGWSGGVAGVSQGPDGRIDGSG